MFRGGFIIPLIAIVAIILAIVAGLLFFGGKPAPPAALAAPTNVTVTAVAGQPDAVDVSWQWSDTRTADSVPVEFTVDVNGQRQPFATNPMTCSPSGESLSCTKRVTGLSCASTVSIVVGVHDENSAFAAPVSYTTAPCATATPGVTAAPSPTTAPQPSASLSDDTEMEAPTDFRVIDVNDGRITVAWSYPAGADPEPNFFRIGNTGKEVDVEYTGPGEYEGEVLAYCGGSTNYITLDAYNTDVTPEAHSQAEEVLEVDPNC
jgi:hypothetical protein